MVETFGVKQLPNIREVDRKGCILIHQPPVAGYLWLSSFN
jgi:hypothetical protein